MPPIPHEVVLRNIAFGGRVRRVLTTCPDEWMARGIAKRQNELEGRASKNVRWTIREAR